MLMQSISQRFTLMICVCLVAAGTARGGGYIQTNLISNGAVPAQRIDPNLQDPWGMSFSGGSPMWNSDQASNAPASPPNRNAGPVTTVYSISQGSRPTVTGNVPALTVGNTAAPYITPGPATDFPVVSGGVSAKAAFIFANLDGTISAWRGGLSAPSNQSILQPTATVAGASFTGLAIANLPNGGPVQIYAADQNSTNVIPFNAAWVKGTPFSDPSAGSFPAGYTTFNVQNLLVNGVQTLFVTYANQNTTGGIVDEFKTDGTFIKTLINDTAGVHLSAPWGMAIAPANWGQFSGDLLVGNNNPDGSGNTTINAYNLTTGAFVGTLMLADGSIFSEPDLWALNFGNGGGSGSPDVLFFNAGLASAADGLVGAISIPEPSSAVMGLIAVGLLAGGWQLKQRRRIVQS
jgi:uncharacterized protein (TIGR03118 family)